MYKSVNLYVLNNAVLGNDRYSGFRPTPPLAENASEVNLLIRKIGVSSCK